LSIPGTLIQVKLGQRDDEIPCRASPDPRRRGNRAGASSIAGKMAGVLKQPVVAMESGTDREDRAGASSERMVTAMREAAARLNGIIQSAMDAIISVDERQNIVIFNPAAESMFGCAGADVIGTPLDQFIPVRFRDTHRSDIERFGATGVTTRRMNARSQVTGLRGNGEEFPLEAAISQVTVGGQKLFTVILGDVSERERSEDVLRESVDRYQRLVDLVPDAIWLEREDRIVFVNRACVHMFGADSSEQLL